MRNNHLLLLSFMIFTFCSTQMQSKRIDKTTVKEVDLNRYMGKWYEIARFPHSFEKNLVGVTATYELMKNDKIRVINEGYKNTLDGKHSRAEGKAKMPDKSEPGKLRVSFFWDFYSDYYILELDKNYQYAMIGSSSDKYFWILSRSPQMDPQAYQNLLDNAQKRGYNLKKLIKVPQPEK